MKDTEKAVNLLKYLIREHEKENFCAKLSEEEEQIQQKIPTLVNKVYQLGRYETLVDLLNTLERMGE